MADNLAYTPGSGATVATDEIGRAQAVGLAATEQIPSLISGTESMTIELLEGSTVRYTSSAIPLSTAAVGTLTVTPATWAGVASWPWAVRVRITTI